MYLFKAKKLLIAPPLDKTVAPITNRNLYCRDSATKILHEYYIQQIRKHAAYIISAFMHNVYVQYVD